MSSKSLDCSENTCIVCFKNVDFYSIGNCDHMVCYECSTRMRVLCCQNECPICRQDLPKVIFTHVHKPFVEVVKLVHYEDKKFNICFQDQKIQDAFYKLLEHYCVFCKKKPTFKTFQSLSDHMRREHDLYYCDLCVENLKVFPSERRCYNKTDLATHRQKGDADDKSHRGHPLCEFCQVRYMDNDFLYRHLRKHHLFCHFCDADGHDLYYNSYDYLREHFREEHYLCEEGACVTEEFTSAFRTEIDLKAHRMAVHGKSMGKAAAKQTRTIELEFSLKPRSRQEGSRKGKYVNFHMSQVYEDGAVGFDDEFPQRVQSPALDPSQFPSLPSGSGGSGVSAPQRKMRPVQVMGRKNASLAITDENFPVLGEHNSNIPGTSVKLSLVQERGNNGRTGSVTPVTPRNSSVNVNHKPVGEKNKVKQDDFPALSSDSSSLPVAKWVPQSNKNKAKISEPKNNKQKKSSDGDFDCLNSRFNNNLHLKTKDTLQQKPNCSNVGNGKLGKISSKAGSVVMPVRSDSLYTEQASTSGLDLKVKKKKTKGNNIEERSDTAKKKDKGLNLTLKDGSSSDKSKKNNNNHNDNNNNNNNIKKRNNNNNNNSSALSRNDADSLLAKPLPTVRDWFGDCKKLQVISKTEDELNQYFENFSKNNKVSSLSKCNSSKTKCSSVDRSSLTNVDAPDPGVIGKNIPPGFDSGSQHGKSNDKSKPPPGFSFDFPGSNGISWTNSCQSFAIPTNYSYTPPLNFEKRNQDLVTNVFQILSNDSRLEQFKKMSSLFRQDMLSADEYYNHCMKTLGEGFEKIFPELLILLPDINKQQELFHVYVRSPKFVEESSPFLCCETCGQVINSEDIDEHLEQHSLHENFPLLMPNSWAK